MWILVIGFASNFVLQKISYSFYKGDRQMQEVNFMPEKIQYTSDLSGYGYNLNKESDKIILFFGGSNYIAYNSVGKAGGYFDCPFISADYYGSQDSKGKMNLKSMQQTALDLYEWTKTNYPNKKIVVIGNSYGSGMATYLASQKNCDNLILISAYRDLADLYNKIIPVFYGPTKIFISDNINLANYAKDVKCKTLIIGSYIDQTLSSKLQKRVKPNFSNSELLILDKISHDEYLETKFVINIINSEIK